MNSVAPRHAYSALTFMHHGFFLSSEAGDDALVRHRGCHIPRAVFAIGRYLRYRGYTSRLSRSTIGLLGAGSISVSNAIRSVFCFAYFSAFCVLRIFDPHCVLRIAYCV